MRDGRGSRILSAVQPKPFEQLERVLKVAAAQKRLPVAIHVGGEIAGG